MLSMDLPKHSAIIMKRIGEMGSPCLSPLEDLKKEGDRLKRTTKGGRGDELLEEVHTFIREAKRQKDLHEEGPINSVIGLR